MKLVPEFSPEHVAANSSPEDSIFYDFLNLFNKDNEWENLYLDDGTIKIAYQYKTIPTAGIVIEF